MVLFPCLNETENVILTSYEQYLLAI